MPRPERPVDPESGAVARFAIGLRELRRCAGCPGYRELAQHVHYSPTTLAQAARGESLPSLAVTLAYVRGCGGDVGEWERRWRATAAELDPDPSPDAADDTATSDCAPYVGLAAYGPEDKEWFHGRKRIVDELDAVGRETGCRATGCAHEAASAMRSASSESGSRQKTPPVPRSVTQIRPCSSTKRSLDCGTGDPAGASLTQCATSRGSCGSDTS